MLRALLFYFSSNIYPVQQNYAGTIVGDTISARFAFSGTLSSLLVRIGDTVRPAQLLASLDRKELQMQLAKELADFERIRAEFEIFVARQGNPGTDLQMYAKKQQQSLLDVSVKAVELSKLRLDQADLVSPVAGIVISIGGMRPGLNITPSANQLDILDTKSLVFSVPLDWQNIDLLGTSSHFSVVLENHPQNLPARLLPFVPPVDSRKPPAHRFSLECPFPVYPGVAGELVIST